MPYLETPNELADWIADELGIYECPKEDCPSPGGDHCEDCKCRTCFIDGMAERIRDAAGNEIYLNARMSL